ncbi:helix-turn-helix domain-containing protein [Ornithinibacillus gellani]|uniref:helix-turn-helix transcriptional regulator n=1 Tax=Ornithinibacillus gellani TaxID=2293253 RepID=UPI000F47AB69|nr:helix-turn-helix transcriptional regulator [Ornithinibacillus gellani]TQS76325.1 helix-turn-helix domain-containing protein [Ornithinibacillus gellani]
MANGESYTTEDIARLLKVSKLTVYDLIKKGELKAYRVGRQMRIDASELESYKQRGQEVQTPARTEGNKASKAAAQSIVISGQDHCLDILARQLETDYHQSCLRSYSGSLDSLIAMYEGKVDMVSTHLFDGDTGTYNIPYVRKLFVSKAFVIVHFIKRQAGLYVAEGNPKAIHGWQDLAKPHITIVNREDGAGARVLLDEQLRMHGIPKQDIKGYTNERTSHLAVASAVANGQADAGVGIENVAKVAAIDFIPMVEESYDLVMLRTKDNESFIQQLLETLRDSEFQAKLQALGYGTTNIGEIAYEQ